MDWIRSHVYIIQERAKIKKKLLQWSFENFHRSQTKRKTQTPRRGRVSIDNGKLLRWASNKDCAFIQLRQRMGHFNITIVGWKRPDYLLQNSNEVSAVLETL